MTLPIEDHSTTAPERIGTAIGVGAAAGALMGAVTSNWGEIPQVLQNKPWPALARTGAQMAQYGGTLALVGGTFATVDCFAESVRGKKDWVNGSLAGAAAGLALGLRVGTLSAAIKMAAALAPAFRPGALQQLQPCCAVSAAPSGRQRSRQQQRRTAARARRSEAASQNDAWEPLTSYAAPEGGVPDDLLQLIPDVEQDDSLLADDAGAAKYWAQGAFDPYSPTGSRSDFDWQSPGGAGDWMLSDYDVGGRGGGAAAGASVGDPNFGFDQLKSEDWSDQLASEVSEGNSFRREQRERYGTPLLTMANLAHATEEELLMGAEAQALRDDKVDKFMQTALSLHHSFGERAHNRYAICVRFGELIEQIEQDDWDLPMEGESQGLPSWVRAALALEEEYDVLNEEAYEEDQLRSAAEVQFFEDAVEQHVQRQLDLLEMADSGSGKTLRSGGAEAADDASLDSLLRGVLPGTDDEFDKAAETEALADDLLARVTQQADAEYLAALTGDLDLGDKEVVVASSEEEEEEEDEEEAKEEEGVADEAEEEDGEEGARLGPGHHRVEDGRQWTKQRRGPTLGATHRNKVAAVTEGRERQKEEMLGLDPLGDIPSDPLLDLLDRHDQTSLGFF
ncbi:outer envelope pore 16-chloroplastic mitochondrial isoform B [Micractinium conductrix]|uniref:Outer envelope pore 16-chloroplastic mitochondrial isoform B n=1 Tax=Micractinium conductrix TaxID=554055 RepID=A0A2P6V745_9CHLO|nr:outer envelope pore 16-chloroplastic mitochondrial isoform B [Micractinium conductrix]|eukprot:PSC69911.1 outer envelope pore 16-chloroplastic mitochondrial isoform B [Micractinium conductrix]